MNDVRICLVIIVKNESHVLKRALDSCMGFVDFVYIADTGSDPAEFDLMEELICDTVTFVDGSTKSLDWRYHHHEWKDFATNRTNAMRAAEKNFPDATHLFMLDADDYVTNYSPYLLNVIKDADGFYVNVTNEGGTTYPRLQLFKAGIGWHYVGVLHEYPDLSSEHTTETLPIHVLSTRQGARNKDPDKYFNDAAVLWNALKAKDCKPELKPRYKFYLAQSYHDAGDMDNAEHWYRQRAADEGGYIEERYVSLYRLARIAKAGNVAYGLYSYCNEAQELCPQRREAACLAMEYANEKGDHARALEIWRDYPVFNLPTGLFINPDVYKWRMYEQAGIAAYYCGQPKLSVNMFYKALSGKIDRPVDVERIIRNMGFAVSKL